jgi:four helix bundle protein
VHVFSHTAGDSFGVHVARPHRVALELDSLVIAMAERAGRGMGWLTDQLARASGSTVLNIAEAVGRTGADRLSRYRMARGEALEVDAALTLLASRKRCRPEDRARARALSLRVVAMLTRLCRQD